MIKKAFLSVLALSLALTLVLSFSACKKESIVLDGTYTYLLGGEIPTFSYVFENFGVTMYVGGEFQAQGTYYVEGDKIYMNFEVNTKVGNYDKKKDEIIMHTSDYGEIVLSKTTPSE